jgi:hypothetical protein
MAITTRAAKQSALTHNELDGNFTDLDGRINTTQTDVATLQTLAASIPDVTDGTANLDVSSIIINSSIDAKGINYNDISFTRVSPDAGPRASNRLVTDYVTTANAALQVNMGAGFWCGVKATDVEPSTGGVTFSISDNGYVDNDNFKSRAVVSTYDYITGYGNIREVALIDSEEVRFQNTKRVEIETQIPMRLIETHADDLPSPAVKGDLIYLGYDGNSVYHGKLIYHNGAHWTFVHDDSQVTV